MLLSVALFISFGKENVIHLLRVIMQPNHEFS